MRRFLFAAVLALLAMSQARADLRILSSPGGYVGDYLQAFARVRQSGERVIIDGPCLSACTLVLSTIPSNRICVTRRAVLGFHDHAKRRAGAEFAGVRRFLCRDGAALRGAACP